MAVLTKKLNIQKTGSSAVACNIYSTTTEAGSTYFPVTVDGVSGTHYVALGSTSDSNATVGRVMKGSTTYAIKSQSKPPYTEVNYTTVGTYSFTVPAGITRLRVAVCGGGGCAGTYSHVTNGETSSIGSVSATGGISGWQRRTGTSKDGFFYSCSQGSGGTPNGNVGTSSAGGAGFALSFTKTSGTYGKGGGPFDSYGGYPCSGGSGGYNSTYLDVTTGSTLTVVVGAGGASTNSQYYPVSAGTSGFVYVAYGGDI